MQNQARDKFIKTYFKEDNGIDLSTSEGFFWLWRRIRKVNVWDRFIKFLHMDKLCAYISLCVLIDYPNMFADAVWEFLKKEKG